MFRDMANDTAAAENTGKVVQIIGPVIDVEFPDRLPAIYNALQVKSTRAGSTSTSLPRWRSTSGRIASGRSR